MAYKACSFGKRYESASDKVYGVVRRSSVVIEAVFGIGILEASRDCSTVVTFSGSGKDRARGHG